MGNDVQVHTRTKEEFELGRRRANEEMRSQVTMFALMIFFTLISFTAVISGFNAGMIKPLLMCLAAVQVALQLYSFMHMKHKGHNITSFFLYGGVLIAFLTVLGITTISWW